MWGFLFMERRRKVRCGVEGLIEGVLGEKTDHQNRDPSKPRAGGESSKDLIESLHVMFTLYHIFENNQNIVNNK